MPQDKVLGLHPGCVFTDHLQVHPDECVEFVAHHLRLAAMFYQSTPENNKANVLEVLKLIALRDGPEDPSYLAADAWLGTICSYYEEQGERFSDL